MDAFLSKSEVTLSEASVARKEKDDPEVKKTKRRKKKTNSKSKFKANVFDLIKLIERYTPEQVFTVSEGERISNEDYENENKKGIIDPKYVTVLLFKGGNPDANMYRFCLTDKSGNRRGVTNTMLVKIHKNLPWKELPKNEHGIPINPLVEWPHRAGPNVGCENVPIAPQYDMSFFRSQLLDKKQGRALFEDGRDVFESHCRPKQPKPTEEGTYRNRFSDLVKKRAQEAKQKRKEQIAKEDAEKGGTTCTAPKDAFQEKEEEPMAKKNGGVLFPKKHAKKARGLDAIVNVKNMRTNTYEKTVGSNTKQFDPSFVGSSLKVQDLVDMHNKVSSAATEKEDGKRKRVPKKRKVESPRKKKKQGSLADKSVEVLIPSSRQKENPFLERELLKNMKIDGDINNPLMVVAHIMNLIQGVSLMSVGEGSGRLSRVEEVNESILKGVNTSAKYKWSRFGEEGVSIAEIESPDNLVFAVDQMDPQWFYWVTLIASMLMRRDVAFRDMFDKENEKNKELQKLVDHLKENSEDKDKTIKRIQNMLDKLGKQADIREMEEKRREEAMDAVEEELQSVREELKKLQEKAKPKKKKVGNSLSCMME